MLKRHDCSAIDILGRLAYNRNIIRLIVLYTIQDLIVARKVAQEYSAATSGNHNEVALDFYLAMAVPDLSDIGL